jgi:hypothetical protein
MHLAFGSEGYIGPKSGVEHVEFLTDLAKLLLKRRFDNERQHEELVYYLEHDTPVKNFHPVENHPEKAK